MAPAVFHIDQARLRLPDPELARLVEKIGADGDHSQAAKFARSLAVVFRDDSVVQPVSRDVTGLNAAELLHAHDLLAGAAAAARQDQHPAADRLAELAAQWAGHAGIAPDPAPAAPLAPGGNLLPAGS